MLKSIFYAALLLQCNAFSNGQRRLVTPHPAFSSATTPHHHHHHQHHQHQQTNHPRTPTRITPPPNLSASSSPETPDLIGGISAGLAPFFSSIYERPSEKGTKTVTTRLPLGNLFDSREYVFECATNMRGYEWTMKEAEELLDDLVDASSIGRFGSNAGGGKEADYELSQIVIVPMEWDQEKYGLGQKYDVHDGQQRLVTLCLMLAALRESFRGDDDMAGTVTELANMLNPPKVRKDDILRIQLRNRDNQMLSRLLKSEMNDADEVSIGKELRNAKSMSVANRHVLENYGRFLFRLKSFTNEERVKLLDFLSMRVHMLVCVPDTPSIARNIVMSQGKGMDNEPIDDFKGLVCFRYTSNEDDMQETFDNWDRLAAVPDIENNIVGRHTVTSACLLRASALLRSKIGRNDHIFALEGWLRHELNLTDKPDGKDFFANYVEPASLALGRYRDPNNAEKAFSYSARVRDGAVGAMIATRLTFLRALTSSVGATKELEMVVLELLLRSTGKCGGKKRMALEDVDRYLNHVERLALWMALAKPPASKRYQHCFEFLDQIETNENLASEDGTYLSLSDEEQATLREELVSFDFGATPTGRKIATALLERLNAYTLLGDDEKQEAASLSSGGGRTVEHILPVQATKKMWGDDWPDDNDREFWVHRLGNLALLSKKASTIQSRLDFVSKKERYEKEVWPLTKDVVKFEVWNRNSLVEHMGNMLNLVDEVWGL